MRRLGVLLLVAVAVPALSPAHAADAPTCGGRPATIVGTPGQDVIVGTPGPDVIAALAGDDVVRGGGGDDVMCGGRGRDRLVSHRGRDTFHGGPGGDRIEARSPLPSRILGGAGDDFLFLPITDEPGYVLDGGPGHDIGEISRHRGATSDAGATVDQRTERFVRDGITTGVVRGLELVGLDGEIPYVYYGTRAQDLVSVSSDLPLVARTYGGDDRVVGGAGDDVVDTGRGQDRIDAGNGHDTCLNAERRTGCEVTS